MKAASRAVASSSGGSTRMTVAAVAGISASPAIVNSSCWKRGRDGWLSQLTAVGRSPGWRGGYVTSCAGGLIVIFAPQGSTRGISSVRPGIPLSSALCRRGRLRQQARTCDAKRQGTEEHRSGIHQRLRRGACGFLCIICSDSGCGGCSDLRRSPVSLQPRAR